MAVAPDAAHSTAGAGATGADLTIDISAVANGSLCICVVKMNGSGTIGVPVGWTVPTNGTDASANAAVLAYREKQAGDTTFVFTIPGVLSSRYHLEVFTEAAAGECQRIDSVAGGTAMQLPAVTFDAAHSVSFVAGKAGGFIAATSGPTGYTQLRNPSSSIWTGWRNDQGAGSFDPADGVWSASATTRSGFHLELLAKLTEIPAAGGATAGGTIPVSAAPAVIGGATADGTTPTSTAPPVAGGATAGGTDPGALSQADSGAAVAGGLSPEPAITAGAASAVAGGQSLTAAVPLSSGGGVATGTAPSSLTLADGGAAFAGGSEWENLEPAEGLAERGGATADGTNPTTSTAAAAGGATAAGAAPTASGTAATGGALAPAHNITVVTSSPATVGGALAGGNAPSAAVILQAGVALAAGAVPNLTLATPERGGAIAGGFVPTPDIELRLPLIVRLATPQARAHIRTPEASTSIRVPRATARIR